MRCKNIHYFHFAFSEKKIFSHSLLLFSLGFSLLYASIASTIYLFHLFFRQYLSLFLLLSLPAIPIFSLISFHCSLSLTVIFLFNSQISLLIFLSSFSFMCFQRSLSLFPSLSLSLSPIHVSLFVHFPLTLSLLPSLFILYILIFLSSHLIGSLSPALFLSLFLFSFSCRPFFVCYWQSEIFMSNCPHCSKLPFLRNVSGSFL